MIIGEPVGTDGGRNGWTVVGNTTYTVTLDFDDGNVNTCEFYGCSFEGITGAISMGTATAHKFFTCSWTNCAQVDPVGGVQIRNNNFIGTEPVTGANTAALLWNASADVQKCQFIANDDPHVTNIAHGIEFPAAGTFGLVDMVFAGNEVGIWFSATTGNLVLNASGATNLGASDYTDDSTGTVTINNNKSITFTGMKDNSEVRVYENISVEASDISFTASSTITSAGSEFGAFTAGDLIRVRGSSSNDGQYEISTATASTITVVGSGITTESAGATIKIKKSDQTEIDGIEDATTGTTDNRSFTWSAAAATVVDYVIHNWQPGVPVYQSIRVDDYTVPSSDTSIPIQQTIDRNAA